MPSPNRKFKAAVIGCGRIGAQVSQYNKAVQPGTHAGAYLANKKTKLVALVENNKARWPYLQKNFPGVKIYEDANLMFKEINPDIVSIATPTDSHCRFVLLAAKYKCPTILCEKPISYFKEEAKKMISACKRSKSQLFVNHTRHFDPLLQKWSNKIKKGFLGQIYQGNAYYYNGLFNNGTHLIDLLRMFLGEPAWVLANFNKETSSLQNDLNVDGLIKFKNGALISLQSLSKNYGYFSFRLVGEKGMLETDNLCYQVKYRKKIANKIFKGFYQLSDNVETEGVPRSLMRSAVDHIVSFLENKVKPISTGVDGLKILYILSAIKKSAQSNGKLIRL